MTLACLNTVFMGSNSAQSLCLDLPALFLCYVGRLIAVYHFFVERILPNIQKSGLDSESEQAMWIDP
jgi:hypothetical protein